MYSCPDCIGNQFLHYALATNLRVFPHLKRCTRFLACSLSCFKGIMALSVWWEWSEAIINTRVWSVFNELLRQCHCVERWYLIILWRQWEVRHPYFPLCFEALWERCGLESIFLLLFWSIKHWAVSVLQLFQKPQCCLVSSPYGQPCAAHPCPDPCEKC